MKSKFCFSGMLLCMTLSSTAHAQTYDVYELDPLRTAENNIVIAQAAETGNDLDIPENYPRCARVRVTSRSEVIFRDITVEQPGTLASLLGDDINSIDSLVVRGPINADDIHTIWSGSFYGALSVANLEYAQIEGNKLPKDAFWNPTEQFTPNSTYINCILLRRIILPEGLEEIGEGAFAYAIVLKDINLPSTLRRIRQRCFTDCVRLDVNPLIIPEGVEVIEELAFNNCKSLTGKVVLPSTIKKIDEGAFFSTKITECRFKRQDCA